MLLVDEELIRLSKEGNMEAFSRLIERYQDRVYAIAYRFFGNEADAKDVAQDVFIKVFHKIQLFRGDSSFLTWIYHITANTCRDELRKRQKRQMISIDETPLEILHQEIKAKNPFLAPEEVVLKAEAERELQSVLNQLPEDQKMIILLREMQGFSYEEIANTMECSLGTVKSRLNRARGALRQLLLSREEVIAR